MRFLIERQNHWRIELEFSSNKKAASSHGTHPLSSAELSAGPYVVEALGGSELKNHSFPSTSDSTQRKSPRVVPVHSLPSHNRSLRQRFRKMLTPRSRTSISQTTYSKHPIFHEKLVLPQEPTELPTSPIYELYGDQGYHYAQETFVQGQLSSLLLDPRYDQQHPQTKTTYVSPTVSPMSPTNCDNQYYPHQQLMSAQNDARESRGGFNSAVNTYPTPPFGSPPNFGRNSSTHNTQCQASIHTGGTRYSPPSQPIRYTSQGSPMNTRDASDSLTRFCQHDNRFEDPPSWYQCHAFVSRSELQSQPQDQRMYESEEWLQKNENLLATFNEAPPIYSPEPTRWQPAIELTNSPLDEAQSQTSLEERPEETKTKKGLRGPLSFRHPLSCGLCTKEFTGPYQRGNYRRHFKQAHSLPQAMPDPDKMCRRCEKSYKRTDARRKHEWKIHRIEDAKPKKRRSEKRR